MGEWDAPHLQNQDHLIMPYIDMCNVACGGHAGSEEIMKYTIGIAIENDVVVGAHPGYLDRVNFGRTDQEMTEQELRDLLRRQIDLFLNIVDQYGITPYHVKPHGALYHACNHRALEMNILIDVMKREYSYLTLLVFPKSKLYELAVKEELTIMVESFIDRSYDDQLLLAARSEIGSTITSVNKAKAQYRSLSKGEVTSIDGVIRSLASQTACIHGDNPIVLDILESIRS